MKHVFLDTGYLLALEIANDQYHQRAVSHWQENLKTFPTFLTTSYIFDEVVTFFNNRGFNKKASVMGHFLTQSPSVNLIHIDKKLFDEGWFYFLKHKDKRYSFTDCI